MEDYKRNGLSAERMFYSNHGHHAHSETNTTVANKRDKRRQQIGTRLSKLEASFAEDKNNFYKVLLHNLQTTLATIQQGTNEEYVSKKTTLEEARDYELTRLRLWEEYQVKRVEEEYKEHMASAKQNYDLMIKLLKEKFYDKLQNQVKQLKEDKLLLNLVNASLWNSNDSYLAVSALTSAAAASSLSLADRRSRRKREISSRFTAGEADDLTDSGLGSSNLAHHGNGTSAGYSSLSKRRRHYATRYSSNDELSGGLTSSAAGHHQGHHLGTNGGASENESNLSDKDYDMLNSLIMNNEDGGVSKIFSEKSKTHGRPNTRGSHKQFAGVQGLKPEELNDDLNLLRNAIKREK